MVENKIRVTHTLAISYDIVPYEGWEETETKFSTYDVSDLIRMLPPKNCKIISTVIQELDG